MRATLPLAPARYVVIDGDDHRAAFASHREAGIPYHLVRIERQTIASSLDPLLSAGDILVNVTMGVDSVSVADWCHRHGVAYIDSSVEPWDSDIFDTSIPPHARTEYAHHQRARRHAARNWRPDGPTAVFCHGANPGLVSHFMRAALRDVAAALDLDTGPMRSRADWAALAHATGTRVIHISERDTQVAGTARRAGEFVNTWSIAGFIEEASMPVEIGWGTHEQTLPPGARHHESGPRNAIYANGPAARALVRSWVPLGGQIDGLALPHSESVTISEYLTVGSPDDPVYRPTVLFAYLPCDAAMASLHETMMRDWAIPDRQRVITSDVVAGRDELGVLLLGHGLGAWWFGSQLNIAEARDLVPASNPTAVQVAAGMLAAIAWVADHPRAGYREPEDLPTDEVLAVARPWLGRLVSRRSDFSPLTGRRVLFDEPHLDHADPWQFANFIAAWPFADG